MTVPVRRTRAEVNTGDIPVGQKASIILPSLADGMPDREEIATAPAIEGPGGVANGYFKQVSFGEEPVKIYISPSNEKNAPKIVDCWNNGKGAEQLIDDKWVVKGWLPVGVVVITKRKYAEILARAKRDTVTTDVVRRADGEDNLINFSTSMSAPFTLVDATSKDIDWLNKIAMER